MKRIYPLSAAKETVLIQPHNIYGGIKHVYEHKNIPLIRTNKTMTVTSKINHFLALISNKTSDNMMIIDFLHISINFFPQNLIMLNMFIV